MPLCWQKVVCVTRATPILPPCCTEGGILLGCGSLGGKVIRQVAVSPNAEGQDICARIVSALVQESVKRGVLYPFLFTKPQNARLFRSLGFYPVAETADHGDAVPPA